MSISRPLPSEADPIATGMQLPPLAIDVTRRQLVKFAGAVDDYEPLHFDHLFVVERGYDGVIAHGWLTGALMCRVATQWPPLAGARFTSVRVRYARPNLPGPSTYFGQVVHTFTDAADRHVELELWGENPAGERIVEGAATAVLEA
jgi:acyl dehydratase